MTNIYVTSPDQLTFLGKTYKCAIGKNGFTREPQEGARKTPVGTFALRECWYRADRVAVPAVNLPVKVIHQNDGWCDDVKSPDYNLHVNLPFAGSHEQLWRNDNIYDIIVPIGFNDTDIIPGKGSAIFFHLAKPDYSPTLGCVAVALPDMLEILAKIDNNAQMVIAPNSI